MFIQLERHFGLYQPGGKGRESRETLAAKKKPTAERRRGFFPKEAGIWRIYPRQRSARALNPGRVTNASPLSQLRGQKTTLVFRVSSAHTGTEPGPEFPSDTSYCSFS